MQVQQNTWGRVSQVLKLGYERYVAVCVWWGMGNRLGILADEQVSLPDSTAHVQRFSPNKMQKQMTVMSFDDITDVLLTYIEGRYKSKHAQDLGVQFSSFFSLFIWFLWFVPQLVHPGSHRPSNSATSVSHEEWNYNQTGKCSLSVQLYMFKDILGILSWCALVVCKLVG